MKTLIYDIELYPNHVCLNYCDIESPDDIQTIDGIENIRKIKLSKYRWIGFNNRRYDHPILTEITLGINQYDSYNLSKYMIDSDQPSWHDLDFNVYPSSRNNQHRKSAGIFAFDENIIDLYEVCPEAARCSLKEFGHRMGYPILENLPYPFDKELTDQEWEHVKEYGKHDIRITTMLWNNLKSEQESREALQTMFPLKLVGGAPGLAARAIISKLQGNKIATDMRSLVDPCNLILNSELRKLFDEFINYDYINGKPDAMKKEFDLKGLKVNFGIGGIHAFRSTGHFENVYDYDINSYYPAIILNCKLGSPAFREIYKPMFDLRLKYKEQGDKRADGLKLVLNSLYGKLKQIEFAHPQIKAPYVALNICILGQFYLMDIADKLGTDPLFINTDGIFTLNEIPKNILEEFENRTGFKFKAKKVKHMILKDVSNAYLQYEDGSVKTTGCFNEKSWSRNAVTPPIIGRSVVSRILRGISIEDTMYASRNPFDFMSFKKAKTHEGHSLLLDDVELPDPKIRFWIAKEGKTLMHKTSSRVAAVAKDYLVEVLMNSEDADFQNLNMDFYIKKAYELYNQIRGVVK